MDMVSLRKDGSIKEILVKPSKVSKVKFKYTWQTAIWTKAFSEYLHAYVAEHKKRSSVNHSKKAKEDMQELFLGDVFQAAIKDRFDINSVIFSKGNCLDIGTSNDLAKAMKYKFLD
jgi:glucose-1-phosphate thymidylyltransferase